MKSLLSLCALLFLAAPLDLLADDQLKGVQEELKNQGFFYGQVDGQPGAETTAALRRYQIRNGLQVTGALNKETLAALRMGPGGGTAAPANTDEEEAPSTADRPDLRSPDRSVSESDKSFLRRQDAPRSAPGDSEPPARRAMPPTGPDGATATPTPLMTELYARTPYESAPFEVQRETLKRAQMLLGRQGFYRGEIDGVPGVDTQRALLRFQDDAALRPTGRLDMPTLDELDLLPGGRASPFTRRPAESHRRVYRGVWVR